MTSSDRDQSPTFTRLNDLVSDKVGGKVIFATDDWFAPAENMLKAERAVWREGVFTEFGKWMDGWETRRRRTAGHDWCIIQLGLPGCITGVEIDTSFFTGNYAPRVSIQAACLDVGLSPRSPGQAGTKASEAQFEDIAMTASDCWSQLLPMSSLGAGNDATCHNYFLIDDNRRWTHIRLNSYPDGGIARLRVYGKAVPDWSSRSTEELVDLVAMENGGACVGYSNAHYGHARNLIGLGRADNMGDGWETARRLDRPAVISLNENGILQTTGSEWAQFSLGCIGRVVKIEVDTNHFRGNFPDSCYIEAQLTRPIQTCADEEAWRLILPAQKLSAHRRHYYEGEQLNGIGDVSHIRLTMAPDGGISRLRVWGLRTASLT